jgi:hypothetical protein
VLYTIVPPVEIFTRNRAIIYHDVAWPTKSIYLNKSAFFAGLLMHYRKQENYMVKIANKVSGFCIVGT